MNKISLNNLYNQVIEFANPYKNIIDSLEIQGEKILTHLNNYRSKLLVLAIGKAAFPMASAVKDYFENKYSQCDILVITNYQNIATKYKDRNFEILQSSHPIPDNNGLRAAKKLEEKVLSSNQNDFVLCLISGGASALIPYPVTGITLEEKIHLTNLLLQSGGTINEINCVRKHISQLKGGGLSKIIYPRENISFILSDVIGDDLSVIASGPTYPDETSFRDAYKVLNTYNIFSHCKNIENYILRGMTDIHLETINQYSPIFDNAKHFLVGSNQQVLIKLQKTIIQLNNKVIIYSNKLIGESRQQAKHLLHFCHKKLETIKENASLFIISGGETTVTIKGTGKGGRNQEMALAFINYEQDNKLLANWQFLSAGTDGIDGPTDAAGAIVDNLSYSKILEQKIFPKIELKNNNSYHALDAINSLIKIGSTGTNVADIQIILLKK